MSGDRGFEAVLGGRGSARKAVGAAQRRAAEARPLTDRERCRELCDELSRAHMHDELPTDAEIEDLAAKQGLEVTAIHRRSASHRTQVGFLLYREDADQAIAILLEDQLDDHWHCRLLTEDRG